MLAGGLYSYCDYYLRNEQGAIHASIRPCVKDFVAVAPLYRPLRNFTKCLISQFIESSLGSSSEGARRRVLWENASKLYSIEAPSPR